MNVSIKIFHCYVLSQYFIQLKIKKLLLKFIFQLKFNTKLLYQPTTYPTKEVLW